MTKRGKWQVMDGRNVEMHFPGCAVVVQYRSPEGRVQASYINEAFTDDIGAFASIIVQYMDLGVSVETRAALQADLRVALAVWQEGGER